MSDSQTEIYRDSRPVNFGRGFGLPPSMLEALRPMHKFLAYLQEPYRYVFPLLMRFSMSP